MRPCAIIAVVTIALSAGAAAAHARDPRQLCVGNEPHCFSTVQAAVDAAQNGDAIHIARGTYAGPITVDVNIDMLGAGAGQTIIKGGGPVLTIGALDAPREPTVTIEGVTVTGGLNTGTPTEFRAHGGGIWVPPGAGPAAGATVTIADSVIAGNGAAASGTIPSPKGHYCPGGGLCPFALADGGGVSNDGRLTLDHTVVSDNSAGSAVGVKPLASDAEGGGIASFSEGTLTLRNSVVRGNAAHVVGPNGRFAEGAGIFADDNTDVTIDDSVIRDNHSLLESSFPDFVDMSANAGGIHLGNGDSTVIRNTSISDNAATATDADGEPLAIDAAMLVNGGGSFQLDDSVISGNRTTGTVGTTEDVGQIGSALELDGGATIQNTRITDNTTTVSSPSGIAAAGGALFTLDGADQPVVVRDSVVSGNVSTATSETGSATVQGAGVTNAGGPLQLLNTGVDDNTGEASGSAGLAEGAGIWSGDLFGGLPPALVLQHASVTRNVLTASPGLSRRGAGLYSDGFPVTLDSTRIEHNSPDDCFGC